MRKRFKKEWEKKISAAFFDLRKRFEWNFAEKKICGKTRKRFREKDFNAWETRKRFHSMGKNLVRGARVWGRGVFLTLKKEGSPPSSFYTCSKILTMFASLKTSKNHL